MEMAWVEMGVCEMEHLSILSIQINRTNKLSIEIGLAPNSSINLAPHHLLA